MRQTCKETQGQRRTGRDTGTDWLETQGKTGYRYWNRNRQVKYIETQEDRL